MRTTRRLTLHKLSKQFLLAGFLSGLLALTLYGCVEQTGSSRFLLNPGHASAPRNLPSADTGLLLLLVPQDQDLTSSLVTAWVDAASEIGVRMQAITDPQFRAMGDSALQYAGLVLPDQLHTTADDELLKAIRDYTQAGGQTMLVYDFAAFALDSNRKPTYPIPRSRLSDLAGVDYALYHTLREKSTAIGPIAVMRSTMRELQVPPGKSSPYASTKYAAASNPALTDMAIANPVSMMPVSHLPASTGVLPGCSAASHSTLNAIATASPDVLDSYSGYLLGNLIYSSFVTQGSFNGTTLASSAEAGLVAGLHKVGRGQVMFVNLPLTYLKVARTDGLLMHGFLRYFAHNVLHMAQLSPVPDGIAGLTLNWHLDSFAAQLPTLKLEKLGVFDEGPFSINMTAGPDAVSVGDAKGWNLDNNPVAQRMLQRFVAKGHAVGSHGGWNHDYYGLNANDSNRSTFQPYLEQNSSAITRAVSDPVRAYLGFRSSTPEGMPPLLLPMMQKLKGWVDRTYGPPLREYSPPVGNNPAWAMDWLEQQGVVASYFAGHTGMGPTRQYREGQLRNPGMWMFPVTPFGRYATFEEFQTASLPKQDVMDWYRSSIDFAVAQNTSRMIYMHPNGANVWPDVLQDLLAYAKTQGPQRFRWYTMTRLADFMTARLGVTWTEQRDKYGVSRFEITHSGSLNEMVWMLPKARYAGLPVSKDGSVTVSDQGEHWCVRAGNTRRASFTALSRSMRN